MAARKPAAEKTVAKKAVVKRPVEKKAPAKKAVGKKAAPAKAKAAPAPKKASASAKPSRPPKPSEVKGLALADFVVKLAPWQQALVNQLHGLVIKAVPDATVAIKWGQPIWCHAGSMVMLKPATKHMSMGLWRGGALKDPESLIPGDSAGMRVVKYVEGDSIPAGVEALIRQAAALNDLHGDPMKM